MRQIPLGGRAVGQFLLVDDEDFERMNQVKWSLDGRGYPTGYVDGKMVPAHRYVLKLGPGDPGVDHKNRNKLDARRSNLRLCTQTLNTYNTSKRAGTTSGYKGVEFRPRCVSKQFRAYINKDGKRHRLNMYATAEEAARAYDRKAIELFGEFASTNFPVTDYL